MFILSSFIFALNSTIPVFLVILVGKFFMRVGIINEEWTRISDRMAFKYALPIVLFLDIAKMDINKDMDMIFIIFCMISTTVMFFFVYFISRIFLKDKTMVGSFAQGSVRGSAAILGIPFVTNIYGDAGMIPLMILAAVPLFNAYSVIILTISSKKFLMGDRTKINYMEIIKSIFKNPLIRGILIGFPFCILGIKLPPILDKSLTSVGSMAVPLMLISIGADFKMSDLTAKFKLSTVATSIKLVLLPLAILPIAIYMGFRGSALIAILVMLGAPSAISGYIMSKAMDNDYVLMSNIVVMTTLFSSVTFTFWIFILKYMELV
nr:AEC family transporter [uncultured Peptostreptococcus sp.]